MDTHRRMQKLQQRILDLPTFGATNGRRRWHNLQDSRVRSFFTSFPTLEFQNNSSAVLERIPQRSSSKCCKNCPGMVGCAVSTEALRQIHLPYRNKYVTLR